MKLRHWWRFIVVIVGSLIWLTSMVAVYLFFASLPALLMLIFWLVFLALQIWGPPELMDRWSRMEDEDQKLEQNQKH